MVFPSKTSVRSAAVAGTFYPAGKEDLAALVLRLLETAEPSAGAGRPKAIISPHAGYIYSGPTAAAAYRPLMPAADKVRRVVLLGPSHFVWFQGLAAPRYDAFETPLGTLAVDGDAIDELCLRQPGVIQDDAPHRREHALEVQLPFVQVALGEVRIVPLVVGEVDRGEVADVLDHLWDGRETVIVISSDLSHYHPYDEARQRDAATAAAIEALESARLGPEDACGCLGIAGLLEAVGRRRLHVRRLDLRNSGDTAGPKERVVGYGAWGVWERPGTS